MWLILPLFACGTWKWLGQRKCFARKSCLAVPNPSARSSAQAGAPFTSFSRKVCHSLPGAYGHPCGSIPSITHLLERSFPPGGGRPYLWQCTLEDVCNFSCPTDSLGPFLGLAATPMPLTDVASVNSLEDRLVGLYIVLRDLSPESQDAATVTLRGGL